MTISSTTPTQSVITTQRGPASWPRGTPSLAARAWPVSERRGKAGRRPVLSSHWAWQWTLSLDTAYTCTPHCRPAPPRPALLPRSPGRRGRAGRWRGWPAGARPPRSSPRGRTPAAGTWSGEVRVGEGGGAAAYLCRHFSRL